VWEIDANLARKRTNCEVLTLSPIVPEGQNMNSRGRQPTEKRQNTFDPVGVEQFPTASPWVRTHGYSGLAASQR